LKQKATGNATSAIRGFFDYFKKLTEERRKAPKDDIGTLLANAQIDGKLSATSIETPITS